MRIWGPRGVFNRAGKHFLPIQIEHVPRTESANNRDIACPLWVFSGHCDLFDHFVGSLLQEQRNVQPQGLCSLEVDDQLELSGALDRQISRFFAFEDAINIKSAAPIQFAQRPSMRKGPPFGGPLNALPFIFFLLSQLVSSFYCAGHHVDHADSRRQRSQLSLDCQRGPRHRLRLSPPPALRGST